MSRLLLLSILVLWMCPRDNVTPPPWPVAVRLGVFLGIYGALVLLMSAWSRRLARRVADDFLGRTLDRYNKATELARYFVPVWFAVGIFGLGWGHLAYAVLATLEPAGLPKHHVLPSEPYWRIPGLLLGTLPAFLAWMGLWWAQYPADRALKEQSVLYQANEGLPIHAPPGFGTFFVEHFRQQLLFTLAPVVLIVSARDLMALGYLIFGSHPLGREGGDLLILPLAITIFILAPELLRRIIPTQPLPPDWPLRARMEALCRRAGLRYRDILLWRTNSSMGNAMVMGLFPQVRYIFLSDLLLETMRDEEIEAVFAHEIGHIVHRHMWWYVVVMALLMLVSAGPLALLIDQIPGLQISNGLTHARELELISRQEQVLTVLGLGLFGLCFGFLSRRFERQADVYAARTMEATREGGPIVISHLNPDLGPAGLFVPAAGVATATVEPTAIAAAPAAAIVRTIRSHVGEYGAAVVGSALNRVAQINNIPVAAHEWLHGSIQQRMRYLHELSADATRTHRFDRTMRRLYWGLVIALIALGAWCCVQLGAAAFIVP
ncbi:MAG: heat shock protein HtpX [Phycisphaerales bacterium]|nr:heat shock protein HtpX [Phycisphaerales bacterium]